MKWFAHLIPCWFRGFPIKSTLQKGASPPPPKGRWCRISAGRVPPGEHGEGDASFGEDVGRAVPQAVHAGEWIRADRSAYGYHGFDRIADRPFGLISAWTLKLPVEAGIHSYFVWRCNRPF